MHYVIFKKDKEIIKKPITADAVQDLPEIAKELARVAEYYKSHIEIDASNGNVFIVDDEELSPTIQIARAIEAQHIYDKYNVPSTTNIKKIPNDLLNPEFKGSVYIYAYITAEEFQGSLIVLDEDGNYKSSYDELEDAFVPEVEGLDKNAVNLARQTFATMTEHYKNKIRDAINSGVIK